MHVIYTPEDVNYWIQFYKESINNNQHYQLGGILPGFRAYAPYHRGSGIGSIFKSLYRFMLPMLQSVGKQALISGSKIATDVATGQDLKSSLNTHAREGVSTILKDTAGHIERQHGKGIGKRKIQHKAQTYKKPRVLKKNSVSKRKLSKLVGSDIFS